MNTVRTVPYAVLTTEEQEARTSTGKQGLEIWLLEVWLRRRLDCHVVRQRWGAALHLWCTYDIHSQ